MACEVAVLSPQIDIAPIHDGFYSPQHSWNQPISPEMSPHYASVHSPIASSPLSCAQSPPPSLQHSPFMPMASSPMMTMQHSPIHQGSPIANVKQESDFSTAVDCSFNALLGKTAPPELIHASAATMPYSAAEGTFLHCSKDINNSRWRSRFESLWFFCCGVDSNNWMSIFALRYSN